MNGLLFPGQGSQSVGMGKNVFEKLASARLILEEASDLLGYDLKKILFDGPPETLTDTKIAQPAIYTCSAMYLEKVRADGLEYEFVAGHSLGEYSALYAADVFSFAEGLHLVDQRGRSMSMMNGKGTMAAVLGLPEQALIPLLPPSVVIANLNTPFQIVVSGDVSGINALEQALCQMESVKFRRLHVSAAFHSPQMKSAADTMKPIIEQTPFKSPRCRVVSNITGRTAFSAAEIKHNLIHQMTGQVRWIDTILTMKQAGVTMLYEVGCSKVLMKMNKAITFRPKCVNLEI